LKLGDAVISQGLSRFYYSLPKNLTSGSLLISLCTKSFGRYTVAALATSIRVEKPAAPFSVGILGAAAALFRGLRLLIESGLSGEILIKCFWLQQIDSYRTG